MGREEVVTLRELAAYLRSSGFEAETECVEHALDVLVDLIANTEVPSGDDHDVYYFIPSKHLQTIYNNARALTGLYP